MERKARHAHSTVKCGCQLLLKKQRRMEKMHQNQLPSVDTNIKVSLTDTVGTGDIGRRKRRNGTIFRAVTVRIQFGELVVTPIKDHVQGGAHSTITTGGVELEATEAQTKKHLQ